MKDRYYDHARRCWMRLTPYGAEPEAEPAAGAIVGDTPTPTAIDPRLPAGWPDKIR